MLRQRRSALMAVVLATLALPPGCSQEVPLPPVTGSAVGTQDAGRDRKSTTEHDAAADADDTPDAELPPDAPARCETVSVQVQHPQVIIAFDRSTSMNDKVTLGTGSGTVAMPVITTTRTQMAQQAVRTLIDKYYRAVYFGYVEFPLACRSTSCCTSGVLSPGPYTLEAIDSWWRCRNMPPSCNDTTADSPVGSAIMRARSWFDKDDNVIASRQVFVLTDGEPSCSLTPMEDQCALASREVSRMAGWLDKVDTVVFGLTEELRTSSCLNDLAASGGTVVPRIAVDGAQLLKAMEEVVEPLSREACTIRLRGPVAPDEELRLYMNRTQVRRDQTRTEGWDFEDGAPPTITVYGEWCDKLSTSKVNGVSVEVCPL
jgi:hypothetical protein